MPVMLFRLRGVADDEADDIRELLAEHHIPFYETENGLWGLGFAAIWLHDDSLYDDALALIQTYQAQRARRAKADYAALCARGQQPTYWRKFKARPVQVLLASAAIAAVLFLVLSPFVF